MAKRKSKSVNLSKDVSVGEGDETITDWACGLNVIEEIAKRLWRLPLEFEWDKVAPKITAYPEFADPLESSQPGGLWAGFTEKPSRASSCRSWKPLIVDILRQVEPANRLCKETRN